MPPPPPTPAASVVCATYRRPDGVRRLLAALAAQDLGRPFEVLVSDDGSGPEVVAALREAVAASPLQVRLLEHPANRGAAAARNDAWRQARAEVVAFTDDDCQPAPDWLRRGLAAMAGGDVVVVGRVTPDPAQAGARGPWSRSLTVTSDRFFQTANAFYRRTDLDRAGGFDEALRYGGEDTDLGLRVLALGRRSAFAPDAVVLHDVRPGTVRAVARERATRWVDLPLVVRKHPQLRGQTLYRRWFWKRSHPPVVLLLAAVLSSPALLLGPAGAAGPVLLALPWLVDRGLLHPPATGWKRRARLLPGTLVVDVAEVVAMVRGSVRHRTLVL